MDDGRSPDHARSAAVTGFFRSRWRGDAPFALVFWRDMVVVGTAINLVFTLVAVVLLGAGLPAALAVAVHFSPLPYNLFLFIAVCRSSARAGGWAARAGPLAAAAWLALTAVI